jgi:hypothetical protein
MNQLKIFAEIGYGNSSFLSTEIEKGEQEKRVSRFVIPPKIEGIYFRFWVGKRVLVLSTKNGFSLKKKDRVKLKILFGIEGKK